MEGERERDGEVKEENLHNESPSHNVLARAFLIRTAYYHCLLKPLKWKAFVNSCKVHNICIGVGLKHRHKHTQSLLCTCKYIYMHVYMCMYVHLFCESSAKGLISSIVQSFSMNIWYIFIISSTACIVACTYIYV